MLSWLVASALLGAAARAEASPDYPEEIQNHLEMACAPPCTICHRDNKGGTGTADRPFAQRMIENGLEGHASDSVVPALDALDTSGATDAGAGESVDSDRDGIGDIAELREERDPNLPGAGVVCGPTYGCGAQIEPGTGRIDRVALSLALAVSAALLFASRRRALLSRSTRR